MRRTFSGPASPGPLVVPMYCLQGLCTASRCPYLHVHVSDAAPLCKAFLRGYCAAGTQCSRKHFSLAMVREEKRLDVAGKGKPARGPQVGRLLETLLWWPAALLVLLCECPVRAQLLPLSPLHAAGWQKRAALHRPAPSGKAAKAGGGRGW